MPRPIAALLILLVALTSIGLGTARGTIMLGTEVVLCTGQGIVVTRLPADPGHSRAHLCPDMALSLMTAPHSPDVALAPHRNPPAPPPPRRLGAVPAASDLWVRVRDPPGLV